MAVGDAKYVFPGCLTPVLTHLFFPKPPTTFLTCFCRGKRRNYAGKKSRLNRGSNSQPPGHESDTLTTEPPGRGCTGKHSPKYYIITLVLRLHLSVLTLSQISPVFTCLQYKSFENTVGNGEIAHNEQFLLFPQCFLPI